MSENAYCDSGGSPPVAVVAAAEGGKSVNGDSQPIRTNASSPSSVPSGRWNVDLRTTRTDPMAIVEPLINAVEASQILKLHPVTVREMAARQELPALKIGKVWRFRASSLDDWIRARLRCACHPLSPELEER